MSWQSKHAVYPHVQTTMQPSQMNRPQPSPGHLRLVSFSVQLCLQCAGC